MCLDLSHFLKSYPDQSCHTWRILYAYWFILQNSFTCLPWSSIEKYGFWHCECTRPPENFGFLDHSTRVHTNFLPSSSSSFSSQLETMCVCAAMPFDLTVSIGHPLCTQDRRGLGNFSWSYRSCALGRLCPWGAQRSANLGGPFVAAILSLAHAVFCSVQAA